MDSELPKKNRKLDFYRPTFNESKIQLPINDTSTSSDLFADDEQSQEDYDSISSMASSTASNNEHVSVFLRVRPRSPSDPPCSHYKFDKLENKVVIMPHKINTAVCNTENEKHYQFTSILERVDQVETFEKVVRPILTNPFEIPGATFASYGCSNSGKTYTILGEDSAGLIPRAITQIFTEYEISPYPCYKSNAGENQLDIMNDENVIAELKLVDNFLSESRKTFKGKDRSWNYENIIAEHNFREKLESGFKRIFVWVSMVEIYNEKLTDLFNTQKGTIRPLKIYSNAGHSYVQGATWLYVANIQQAFEVLNQGLNRISYASTGVNAHSSRSHTIFTINIIGEVLYGSEFHITSFKFCDLAGAERLKKTGNIGERLKEAGGINTSLLVLGRCLEGVIHNQKITNKKQPDAVVPVRDSKLTLLIQKSLLGREKFLMVVNLCPSYEFLDENLNVLKFGSIANQIVVKKSELRKYKRQSIRFSFLHNDTASPKKNLTLNNSTIEESELEDSYYWDRMSHQELLNNLQLQRMEITLLRKTLEEREREALLKDRENRKNNAASQDSLREGLTKQHLKREELLKSYYEKKLESQKISNDRKLAEAFKEIEDLKNCMKTIRNQKEIDDEDSEEDNEVFEIDDD